MELFRIVYAANLYVVVWGQSFSYYLPKQSSSSATLVSPVASSSSLASSTRTRDAAASDASAGLSNLHSSIEAENEGSGDDGGA